MISIPSLPSRGWYEPERRNLASLRRQRRQLADAANEVEGVHLAYARLLYSAKHCPSTEKAVTAMRAARDTLAELAAQLDGINGPGDYDDEDETGGDLPR